MKFCYEASACWSPIRFARLTPFRYRALWFGEPICSFPPTCVNALPRKLSAVKSSGSRSRQDRGLCLAHEIVKNQHATVQARTRVRKPARGSRTHAGWHADQHELAAACVQTYPRQQENMPASSSALPVGTCHLEVCER